jgi:hypothetical protein
LHQCCGSKSEWIRIFLPDPCTSAVKNSWIRIRYRHTTGINDTGGKFATGINDTGGKFAAGNNDTGGKFATGINDTSGKVLHHFP